LHVDGRFDFTTFSASAQLTSQALALRFDCSRAEHLAGWQYLLGALRAPRTAMRHTGGKVWQEAA
jgi:hypothetical protein